MTRSERVAWRIDLVEAGAILAREIEPTEHIHRDLQLKLTTATLVKLELAKVTDQQSSQREKELDIAGWLQVFESSSTGKSDIASVPTASVSMESWQMPSAPIIEHIYSLLWGKHGVVVSFNWGLVKDLWIVRLLSRFTYGADEGAAHSGSEEDRAAGDDQSHEPQQPRGEAYQRKRIRSVFNAGRPAQLHLGGQQQHAFFGRRCGGGPG